MNTSHFFLAQLRHWAIHLPIWALPSFIVMTSSESPNPKSIAAMLVGIAIFCLIFSALATACLPQKPSTGLKKAILWSSRLRSGLAILFIPGSLSGQMVLLFPDFCTGYVSVLVTGEITKALAITNDWGNLVIATLIQGSLIVLGYLLLAALFLAAIRKAYEPVSTVSSGADKNLGVR